MEAFDRVRNLCPCHRRTLHHFHGVNEERWGFGTRRQGESCLEAPAQPPVRGGVITEVWVNRPKDLQNVPGEFKGGQGASSSAMAYFPALFDPKNDLT